MSRRTSSHGVIPATANTRRLRRRRDDFAFQDRPTSTATLAPATAATGRQGRRRFGYVVVGGRCTSACRRWPPMTPRTGRLHLDRGHWHLVKVKTAHRCTAQVVTNSEPLQLDILDGSAVRHQLTNVSLLPLKRHLESASMTRRRWSTRATRPPTTLLSNFSYKQRSKCPSVRFAASLMPGMLQLRSSYMWGITSVE